MHTCTTNSISEVLKQLSQLQILVTNYTAQKWANKPAMHSYESS